MNIVHGSSRCLARALRRAGAFIRLRNNKRRFTSETFRWDQVPPSNVHTPDWARDIFLAYPNLSNVRNAPTQYQAMVDFYRSNKYEQWQALKEFFVCPEFKNPPFVKRPLRHEGGIGFEVTSERPSADHDSRHYWRSLWKRNCEYRVFFVRGQKVLTLLKRVPQGTAQGIPWNHGVSSFVTVHKSDNDRLRHTAFYTKATAFFKAFPFHLCAVDVLYRDCKHSVVEVNFSPGVLIPENLQTLTRALLQPTHAPSRNSNTASA